LNDDFYIIFAKNVLNMATAVPKGNSEIKAEKCKDLIVVLEETCSPKTIETVVRNIHAFGVTELCIVDRRNIVTIHLEEELSRKVLFPSSESKIRWSFIKPFISTEECLEYLEKKDFTPIVISPPVNGKNNVILQEGNFTQKRLAVWFGNENRGASALLKERSEDFVNVEMYENMNRLDLSALTAMVLYEITKQRKQNNK
jgi:tRNA (guanosine-2'-O-)-methyltransferase